jgi:hypothetical protein
MSAELFMSGVRDILSTELHPDIKDILELVLLDNPDNLNRALRDSNFQKQLTPASLRNHLVDLYFSRKLSDFKTNLLIGIYFEKQYT